ncbi:DUF4132 domain-containing protein [Glycomyces terrestris]|uniref:DUF4132 domain-containing protein n=1 Tax=Glycomyces terrestris TaxID=2493553 RepID=A0A426V1N0_9ACTN|nr:DUF4132 domain-containing protein [Glycomyces terrestris]RRS00743.1 DUF4132 domain-containing protein [Glycomyces terrestris]
MARAGGPARNGRPGIDSADRTTPPDLAEASRNAAAVAASRRADLVAALELPECAPDLGRAGLAHLNGEPSPLGAAVVLTLMRYAKPYSGCLFNSGGEHAAANRELFAAVVADHGLPFAVAAAIEELEIDTHWGSSNGWGPDGIPTVGPGGFSTLKWLVVWSDPAGVLPLARGLVAAADDDEYRRIVAAAAAHRDTPLKRIAAAMLLPDERDWVAAACEDRTAYAPNGLMGNADVQRSVWSAMSGADHLRASGLTALAQHHVRPALVAELTANLGAAALPVFAKTLGRASLELGQRTLLYRAISLLPSDEAAEFLVEQAAQPGALAAVKPAAARFPHRFARAVAAKAAGLPAADRFRLAGALRQDEVPLDDVLKGLDADARPAVEALLAEAAPAVAAPEQLPAALAAPPWAERRRRRPLDPVPGLHAPAGVEIVWPAGAQEAALAVEPAFAEWDEDTFWFTDAETGIGFADRLLGRLARGGAAEAAFVLEKLRNAPKHASALVPIRSAAAAALAADWFARLKSARVHAADWLDHHGAHAVPYLVPCALGEDKRLRDGGEAALRHLARRLGDRAVLDAAAPSGPAALARVEALLATDPRVPLAGAVTPGAWADPAMLPPVMLRGNELALPADTVRHLVAALALWTPRLPFPGVDDFAAHCDPASLRRFSLALFDLWLRAEAPAKDSWAVDQLGAFGDDETVAVLGPLVASWPGRSQNDRALTGLDVLAHIGTEAAFTALRDISRSFKYANGTSERARELAAGIAAARGLTYEGLADRLLPDHGVPGPLAFDYGPRRFHLTFDRLLTPRLTDDDGRPRKALPKPGVRDDAAAAKAAAARYKALVKTVETTAEEQAELLRDAMLGGRVLTLDDLRVLDAHPITGVFTRRLAWYSRGAGFRIAEDGGFADVEDREFAPDPAAIRLAHPGLLGDDTAAWAAVFADYEVIQPFDQLTRPALRFTADELETGRLTRFDGLQARYAELDERLGWTQVYRSADEPAAWVWRLQRPVPGGWILADATPAPDRTDPDPDLVHTVTAVRLQANRNRHPKHARPLPGRAIDPVAAAELLARLSGHTRTS